LIKSFNSEILILIKMKNNEHPLFNNYKEQILDTIQEKVYSIKSKLLDINQKLNDSMEKELLSTIKHNNTVFKSKL
jgi:hypothetical protein